jgi:hypothetical protein
MIDEVQTKLTTLQTLQGPCKRCANACDIPSRQSTRLIRHGSPNDSSQHIYAAHIYDHQSHPAKRVP